MNKFVVHGRWDKKYLGFEPEFDYEFNTYEEGKRKLEEMLELGAGTLFFEQYREGSAFPVQTFYPEAH